MPNHSEAAEDELKLKLPAFTWLVVLFVAVAFVSGCAMTRFIAESTYPDYYEVHFNGAKGKKTLFCTVEQGGEGTRNVLECVDAAKFLDTLLGNHEQDFEARFSVEPGCACSYAEGAVDCECDGGSL